MSRGSKQSNQNDSTREGLSLPKRFKQRMGNLVMGFKERRVNGLLSETCKFLEVTPMSDMAASFSVVERLLGLVEANQPSSDLSNARIPFIPEVDQRLAHTTLLIEPVLDSAIVKLRNNWFQLSESQRAEFEQFAQQIYLLNSELKGVTSLKFRLSLLPVSIYYRRDIYGLANKSALRLAKTILETSKTWNELKIELSAFDDGKASWGIYDEEEELILFPSSLSASDSCEIVDWGEPKGVEVW